MRQGPVGRKPLVVGQEHLIHTIGIERLGGDAHVAAQNGGLQAATQPGCELTTLGAEFETDVGNRVLFRQFAIY